MIEKLIKSTRYHISSRICWFFLGFFFYFFFFFGRKSELKV